MLVHLEQFHPGSLRLSARGEWIHDGVAFQNKNVIELFFRSVVRDGHGYRLVIGQSSAEFVCDDVPYFVADFNGDTGGGAAVTLSDGRTQLLHAESLVIGSENQLYCRLDSGELARFFPSVQQRIMENVISENSIALGDLQLDLRPR